MREVKKMWFVINAEKEARKSSEGQWDYLPVKEKLKRSIRVVEMDAVMDENGKWIPVMKLDEVIGSEISKSTYEKLYEDYGIIAQ